MHTGNIYKPGMQRSEYISCLICFGVGMITILTIALYRIFNLDLHDIIGVCPMYKQYGLYCFGCGGTRAVYALLHGDILLSIKYHPIIFYIAVMYIYAMLRYLLYTLSKHLIRPFRFRPEHGYIAIAVIILQCVAKNFLVIVFGIYCI